MSNLRYFSWDVLRIRGTTLLFSQVNRFFREISGERAYEN